MWDPWNRGQILQNKVIQRLIFLKNKGPVHRGVTWRTGTYRIHGTGVNILQNKAVQRLIFLKNKLLVQVRFKRQTITCRIL